jgi:hypothetical protein
MIKNKKAQEQKCKILAAMPKKAQEEMVGFALIIIVVAVIILVFLGFPLKSTNNTETQSYEVESFLQAVLQYTTDCEDYTGYLSIQKLVIKCDRNQTCLDERNSCDALNSTLDQLTKESWKIEGDRPIKGYSLNITSNEEEILSISKGNVTRNSKMATQDFTSGKSILLTFTAYS